MDAVLSEETLKQDLEKFPSTFDFDLTNLTKDRVKNIIIKLKDDRDRTRKLEAEDIQISNFLSYLYFLLGDYEHAREQIEESLQKDPDNIIANTNKARIILEEGEISDVDDIIAKLQKLKGRDDFDRRKCYAEADLAYAYSRSGPWYHQKAVDLFTQVVAAYPTEYAWQYGLGLTLLRQTHLFISQAVDRFNPRQNEETTIHAAELLLTVAEKSDDPVLRANAYARLGKAVHSISNNHYTNVPDKIKRLQLKECLEKAVKLCPEEPSVLEICGQLARYSLELDKSETLLRKALQIKETCHAYHHLALTLKRRVESSHESRDRSRGNYQGGQERTVMYSRSDDHSKGDYNCSLDDVDCNEREGMYNPGQDVWSTIGTKPGYSRKHGSQNKNGQQNKSSRPYTPDQLKEKRLRQRIKSPFQVPAYPENELLVEAINLLEKSEDLAEFGLVIQYDKGIIYRMLGKIEKAVEVFKKIVSKRKYHPTESPMTNVYEQLGLCLLELSKSEDISPQIQQKYKKDGQVHLLHAIQLQSEIVANDPQFKEAWNSYPTLKELFSDERDGKPKQMAVLHMLMKNHKDSITIYEELLLKEEGEMNQKDCINLLECYKRDGQFEKCVAVLRSLECTTFFSGLPLSLIFDVYIDCAFHAYTTDNTQLAHQHFRRAFKVYSMFDKINGNQTTKDILILHSCSHDSECKLPRDLGTILKDVTGLRYTINSDDALPNHLLLTSMVSFIQKIPCIIIMTHGSADTYDPLFVDQAIQRSSEQCGPQVLVVSDDKRNMPDIARTKPFIRMPPPLESDTDPNGQIPEEHQEWIKEFITFLKPK